MDTLFIELYECLANQIDSNRNDTHRIPEEKEWDDELNKDDCKYHIRQILNSDPEYLEPLYSRMAKCKAIKSRKFDAHVFDGDRDYLATSVWECLNGPCEAGYLGLAFLITFEEDGHDLDESVYIRATENGTFKVYDLKPYREEEYEENSDTTDDTSSWGEFKKENPRAASYIEKWEKSDKDLGKELTKWEKMLWLGRSLAMHDSYPEPTKAEVIKLEQKVIEEYKDDPDFQKYMYINGRGITEYDEEYGDKSWAEINCNVGALRYLLWGEWDLDS